MFENIRYIFHISIHIFAYAWHICANMYGTTIFRHEPVHFVHQPLRFWGSLTPYAWWLASLANWQVRHISEKHVLQSYFSETKDLKSESQATQVSPWWVGPRRDTCRVFKVENGWMENGKVLGPISPINLHHLMQALPAVTRIIPFTKGMPGWPEGQCRESICPGKTLGISRNATAEFHWISQGSLWIFNFQHPG